jgi:drug/metabolite transporter (DMT)-like permease
MKRGIEAIVLAALFYAISGVYARRHVQGVNPVVVATGQLAVASVIVWVLAMVFEEFDRQDLSTQTIFSVLWLGLLGSCLAYILYYFVLRNWGATRTTLVTYLIPVVGVTVGIIFLNEMFDWRLIVGGLLILSGVWLVNWRPRVNRAAKSF